MERHEEQPSSTDELAYGRPAEPPEQRRPPAGGHGEPGGGEEPGAVQHAAPAPTDPGSRRDGPATADPGVGQGGPADPGREAPAPGQQHASPRAPEGTGHGHEAAAPGADAPMSAGAPAGASERAAGANGGVPLLGAGDTETFERRWQDIQVGFVDEPARCVEQADSLVADVMKRLAEGFAEERKSLESQWSRGDEVSTEDLRVALQRYRSFFNRLLSTSG